MLSTAVLLTASMVVGQAVGHAAEKPASETDSQAQIIEVEEQWAKALVESNVSWFDRVIVDDWQFTLPDGQIWDKNAWMDSLKTGALVFTSCKLLELRVRTHGRTAVATGRCEIKGKSNGDDFNHEERFTDVFVEQQGRWRCVSSQSTIPNAKRASPSAVTVTPMPDDLRKHINEYVIGDWDLEATHDGATISGGETWGWSTDNLCLTYSGFYSKDGEKVTYTGIMGWDGAEGVLVSHMFTSDGNVGTTRWTKLTPTQWTGVWVGTYMGGRSESPAKVDFAKALNRYEDTTNGKAWVSIAKRKSK